MLLRDCVAIVTGAASGIGRATALALAREGASVALVDRDRGRLEDVAREARSAAAPAAPERILVSTTDVSSEVEVDAMARGVLDRFGRIDALVHCAGILRAGGGAPRRLADVSLAEWNGVLDVNLRGTFLCNRAVLPAMMKRREGQVINLSSTSGRRGRALDGPYCASKFGVLGLTESLAEEVRPFGIKVLGILPAAVDTPLWQQNAPIAAPQEALAPERVADLILYVLKLPRDTILDHLTIAPFRTRRRRPRPGTESGDGVPVGAEETRRK
jgi:NAD(P)-dependent dehydrogenase (short-subunit alcohol dehydrogenase family)